MSGELKDRIDASCVFVNSMHGTTAHVTESSKQKDCLLEILRTKSVPSSAVPGVMASLGKCKWVAADYTAIVQALSDATDRVGERPRPSGGSSQQDFTSFMDFLTASQWRRASSGEVNVPDIFITALSQLGCRNPNELTSRGVTAAVMLCSEDKDKLRTLPPDSYKSMYLAVKRKLKNGLHGIAPLQHLPRTPELF